MLSTEDDEGVVDSEKAQRTVPLVCFDGSVTRVLRRFSRFRCFGYSRRVSARILTSDWPVLTAERKSCGENEDSPRSDSCTHGNRLIIAWLHNLPSRHRVNKMH